MILSLRVIQIKYCDAFYFQNTALKKFGAADEQGKARPNQRAGRQKDEEGQVEATASAPTSVLKQEDQSTRNPAASQFQLRRIPAAIALMVYRDNISAIR